MIHGHRQRKLGVDTALRKSMLRNLVRSLILNERIETTVPRAKEAAPLAERLLTLARQGDLAARRNALRHLPDPTAVKKLFDDIAPRYGDRAGGYTRILRTRQRPGDGAFLCILEWIERKAPAKPTKGGKAADEEPKAPAVEAKKKEPKAKKEPKPKKDEAGKP